MSVARESSHRPVTIDGYCTLGVDREFNLTESGLLKAMDKAGVEWAVIGPTDRLFAAGNRDANESIRKSSRRHNKRLIPSCTVNPWLGDAALSELKRAIGEGARVFLLHPFIQGFLANDELVFPLLDLLQTQKLPVYIHTGQPGNSTPFQVVDLAERYPSLDFIIGHCGATDFWNDAIFAGNSGENIYLEASFSRPFHFARHIKAIGKQKGIMGSSAPLNDLVFEWEQIRKYLPPETHNDLCGGNLLSLLEKGGPL
jgi:predicted TIM-barrel fold metal-dependent hydrolase